MLYYTTLWEIVMKIFEPDQLLLMGLMHGVDRLSGEMNENDTLDQERKEDYLHVAKATETLCDKLDLKYSKLAVQRMKGLLSEDTPILRKEIIKLNQEIEHRVIDEMQSRKFFSLEPDKQHFVTDFNLFGEDVANKFPSAAFDIEEAGKCLAFERNSSCVFHLMKALEVGLYSLASDLSVAKIQENWNNMIEQIEKAKNQFEGNKPSKQANDNEIAEWKAKLEFYSDCATHFRYIKDAWRNHNTHTRPGTLPYSDEKSRQIYDNVRGFMQTMATRLNEKPYA